MSAEPRSGAHAVVRRLSRAVWRANGRFGPRLGAGVDARVTVLITYFHRSRLRYLDDQVRNLLRGAFVERVVLSNHNPEFRLEDVLRVRDPRVVIVQQDRPRGCGYRWMVARDLAAPYLIVVDDDLLLYPWQVARVFRALVSDPTRPHGIAGMVFDEAGGMQYVQGESREVDYLCELYAVTADHVRRYHEMRERLRHDDAVVTSVDQAADFVLVSHAGTNAPRIHPAGRIFRDETFNQHGVAVHQQGQFGSRVGIVRAAVAALA